MTDKKVMADKTTINGVDVSECVFLNTERNLYCCCCDIYEDDDEACLEHPNCYYKSLRRKIAECEELKKAAFTLAEGLNIRQKKLEEIEMICEAQDLKTDWTALEILDIIKKTKEGEK